MGMGGSAERPRLSHTHGSGFGGMQDLEWQEKQHSWWLAIEQTRCRARLLKVS